MSDLIEKVARVLCVEDGETNPDRVLKLEGYPVAWTYYVDEARAAIAAVAEWLDGEGRDIAATQLRAAAGSAPTTPEVK